MTVIDPEGSTPVDADLFLDPTLSLRAKGLMAIIRTYGDERPLTLEFLASQTADGITATRNAVKELERAGRLQRTRLRNPGGTFGDTAYSTPGDPIPSPADRSGWAYAIGEQGQSVVKIGCSSDPIRRLAVLQTGWPRELVIRWRKPGGAALEAHLHAAFAERRLRGEWFDFTGADVVGLIDAAAGQFGAR